ncbi:MAG: hypothetical protein ICV64_00280 [Thermoleophilia bacterium]|nr:hypothetical protein [Thermoleophilia bacterium]
MTVRRARVADAGARARGAASSPAVQLEGALGDATERRLLRLGFDLHDGALQSVVALGADLRLFRDQLAGVLAGGHAGLLLGRVDDLEARLLDLERELRELAGSLESTSLASRPFREAMRAEVDAFAARSGVSASVTLAGPLDQLTASQRLALLRIVQESLTNAREHGGASTVAVEVAEDPGGVELVVHDDGCGFSVDDALEAAAADGRLGLAGMRQRVALLGGDFEIDSRPGGPTVVSARLPRWQPVAEV